MIMPAAMPRLTELFAQQDSANARNAASIQAQASLLDRAVRICERVTIHINAPEYLGEAEPERRVVANLLHASWCSLVSSIRLLLCGAHVDALMLMRGAFEDSMYAEFFRHHPDLIVEWDRAGMTVDLKHRRRSLVAFDRKHEVRKDLERRDDQDRTRLFNEMSGYGTHTTTATVSLRIARGSGESGRNFGFMSTGKVEATQLTAIWALSVATYVLSELQDSFEDYLAADAELARECGAVLAAYKSAESSYPSELSLYK